MTSSLKKDRFQVWSPSCISKSEIHFRILGLKAEVACGRGRSGGFVRLGRSVGVVVMGRGRCGGEMVGRAAY